MPITLECQFNFQLHIPLQNQIHFEM
jgi:hypothetical protein